jgi:hypothetical protein
MRIFIVEPRSFKEFFAQCESLCFFVRSTFLKYGDNLVVFKQRFKFNKFLSKIIGSLNLNLELISLITWSQPT